MIPGKSNPPQQWFELIATGSIIGDFGSAFGKDFGFILQSANFPQYTEQTPQVVIIDGCWVQRESPKSNQRS